MNSIISVARAMVSLSAFHVLVVLSWPQAAVADEPPLFEARVLERIDAFDAHQAVAANAHNFYAVNNFRITRHERDTGKPQRQWDGISKDSGPLIHLNSGMVLDGRLYAAHSNYPGWPMTSSIEVWDADTMEHIDSISLGISVGSMTWVDRHDGSWWAGFANYDKIQSGQDHPYGETRFTQIVQMDDDFTVRRRWTLPDGLLARMAPMSNSGGSWGPGGYLYLTGHDYPEIYVVQLPRSGSQLHWVATVRVPDLNGQGIAWDRSADERILWAILRRQEQVYQIQMPDIQLDRQDAARVRGPDKFTRDRD